MRDGNVITSRKPDDLPAFAKTILQAVQEVRESNSAPFTFSAREVGPACRAGPFARSRPGRRDLLRGA